MLMESGIKLIKKTGLAVILALVTVSLMAGASYRFFPATEEPFQPTPAPSPYPNHSEPDSPPVRPFDVEFEFESLSGLELPIGFGSGTLKGNGRPDFLILKHGHSGSLNFTITSKLNETTPLTLEALVHNVTGVTGKFSNQYTTLEPGQEVTVELTIKADSSAEVGYGWVVANAIAAEPEDLEPDVLVEADQFNGDQFGLLIIPYDLDYVLKASLDGGLDNNNQSIITLEVESGDILRVMFWIDVEEGEAMTNITINNEAPSADFSVKFELEPYKVLSRQTYLLTIRTFKTTPVGVYTIDVEGQLGPYQSKHSGLSSEYYLTFSESIELTVK